jgi:hypothetical protein
LRPLPAERTGRPPLARIVLEAALGCTGGTTVAHIVFGWTTPALLAGAKSVIRLPETNRQPERWHPGTLVPAYSKLPHHGGRPIGVVQVTADPALEPLAAMPESDYEAEGWGWLHEHRDLLPRWITRSDFNPAAFDAWRRRDALLWVVRFRLVAAVMADEAKEARAEALAEARAA